MPKKTPLDVATEYTNRGWKVVPVRFRGKGCFESEWQKLRLEIGDLPQHFNSSPQNIGVLLGEPSGGLIDVDLDCPESLALADEFLPQTNCKFGRASKRESHWLYKATTPGATKQFTDITKAESADNGNMLLEYRSANVQTVFPGSIHEEGEAIEWDEDGSPSDVDGRVLLDCVSKLAAAALLMKHWPGQGNRQKVALALSGGLLRAGWNRPDVDEFLTVITVAAGDEETSKRISTARHTARNLSDQKHVTGWPTLAGEIGRPVVDKVCDWLGISTAEFDWPTLEQLPSVVPPMPTLSPELVPAPIRNYLVDAAEGVSIPLEMVACPLIVSLSAVVGTQIGIKPNRFDDFLVIPNLWGGFIARPGFMKSHALEVGVAPLKRLAEIAHQRFEIEAREEDDEKARIQIEVEELNVRLGKETKAGGDTGEIRDRLVVLKNELNQMQVRERRYLTQDATIAKLGELLRDNPRGMLVVRDELSGLLQSMNKPGEEDDRQFYLESWNGTNSYQFDRIKRGEIFIPALCLSILGGIQPGAITKYISEAIGNKTGADGLLQRFQILVWPDGLGEYQPPTGRPDTEAQRLVHEIFEYLDNLGSNYLGGHQGNGSVPSLRFDPAAQDYYDQWRKDLEGRLRAAGLEKYPAFESYIAKFRSLLPSLALLFHLLDVADLKLKNSHCTKSPGTFGTFGTGANGESESKLSSGVPLEATKLAEEWCSFLEAHARKVYAAELYPGSDAAHALADRITEGTVVDGQTVREIQRHHWSGLTTYGEITDGLNLLEECGWVKIERRETGGRPSEIIRIHPDVRFGFNQSQ